VLLLFTFTKNSADGYPGKEAVTETALPYSSISASFINQQSPA